MKECVREKHLHSFCSTVGHGLGTVKRKQHWQQPPTSARARGGPGPLHSGGRSPPGAARTAPTPGPRPGRPQPAASRAAHTWRRLPPGQTPPDAPAPASPRWWVAGWVRRGGRRERDSESDLCPRPLGPLGFRSERPGRAGYRFQSQPHSLPLRRPAARPGLSRKEGSGGLHPQPLHREWTWEACKLAR